MPKAHRVSETYNMDTLPPQERRRNVAFGCMAVVALATVGLGVYWLAASQERVIGEVTLPRLQLLDAENTRLRAELAEAQAQLEARPAPSGTDADENALHTRPATDPNPFGLGGMRLWVDRTLNNGKGGLRLDTTIPVLVHWEAVEHDLSNANSFSGGRGFPIEIPGWPLLIGMHLETGNGQLIDIPEVVNLGPHWVWVVDEWCWRGGTWISHPLRYRNVSWQYLDSSALRQETTGLDITLIITPSR